MDEPEAKACRRTPAVKLSARGLNYAPSTLIEITERAVKNYREGQKQNERNEQKRWTEGRHKEGETRRKQRQKDGKEKGKQGWKLRKKEKKEKDTRP
jgi:hypothetical protein